MSKAVFAIVVAIVAGRAFAGDVPPALSPEAERAAMHVMDGFDVQCFASEADGVVKPIQMRFDERGRLWVSCSPTYPQIEPGDKPNDKILVLEDTDGDGRCDKTTVFADGLFIPTGLELVGDGKVLVGTGTKMLLLTDTDGDLKADKTEVLLSGFGTGDGHQMINSFQWGPGGDFWFSQGAHTFSNVETPWGIERLYSAGIWRMRPRTMRLDPFLDSRRGHPTNSWAGPANPWGLAFDQWGQVICNDAAGGKGISFISPSLIRSDRHVPVEPLWRIPKGCGIDIVGSAGLPAEMQGRLLSAHYFTASVRQFQISDNGSGFALTELPPLITADTNAFRSVDIHVGPDGAIWLCDWYNPVIGHYQASYRDPNRDKTHGRIWRLKSKTVPPLHPPQLAGLSPAQLLQHLGTSDRWTQYQVNRLLFTAKSSDVIPAADAFAAKLDPSSPGYEQLLYRTIGLFQSHDAPREALLQKLVSAKDPGARAYSARVVAQWQASLREPLKLLERLATDASPRVRMEAVVASTFVPDPHAIEVASLVADQPIDSGIEHAMLRAVDAMKDRWRPAFLRGELTFGNSVKRLAWVLRCDGSAELAPQVRQMLARQTLSPDDRHELALLLAAIGNADDLWFLLDGSATDAALLEELATAARVRNVIPSGSLEPAVAGLLRSKDPALQLAGVHLAGAWKLSALGSDLKAVAANDSADAPLRAAAIASLAMLKPLTRGDVEPFLASMAPAAVRVAAVRALIDGQRGVAANEAAKLLATLDDPAEVGSLLAAFVSKKGGAAQLGKAIDQGKLSPQAAQRCLDILHARGRDDASLVDALKKVMGVSDATPPYSDELVRRWVDESAARGDAARGQTLYQTKMNACAACHAINGQGGVLGPDLSAIGRGLTPQFIVESVLWPRRQVKEGYLSLTVTMADGDEYTGYAVSEDGNELKLKDVATGETRRLPKASITKRLNAGTIMPEGLTATLTEEETRDLFAYLMHLGK